MRQTAAAIVFRGRYLKPTYHQNLNLCIKLETDYKEGMTQFKPAEKSPTAQYLSDPLRGVAI